MSVQNKSESGFFLPLLLAVIVAFAAGFFVKAFYPTLLSQVTSSPSKPKTTVQEITIPSDVVKISGCIPFEGEHWVRTQDLPRGPFYVTYNGKLTAFEYMFNPEEIPGKDVANMSFPQLITHMQTNKLELKDVVNNLQSLPFDLKNATYTYSDLHWTAPHAGQLKPHFDLHFYVQSREEMKKVCPDATLQGVLPDSLVKDLIKEGVPLPQ
jgi:hypothetical protein